MTAKAGQNRKMMQMKHQASGKMKRRKKRVLPGRVSRKQEMTRTQQINLRPGKQKRPG